MIACLFRGGPSIGPSINLFCVCIYIHYISIILILYIIIYVCVRMYSVVVSSLGAVFEGIILTHHIITSYFTIINPFHVFISRIIHYLHFMYPSHPHSSYHSSSPFFFASFFPSKKFPHHSFFTIISSLFELCPKVSHRI